MNRKLLFQMKSAMLGLSFYSVLAYILITQKIHAGGTSLSVISFKSYYASAILLAITGMFIGLISSSSLKRRKLVFVAAMLVISMLAISGLYFVVNAQSILY